jgi:hypothetical protein
MRGTGGALLPGAASVTSVPHRLCQVSQAGSAPQDADRRRLRPYREG